VVEGGPGHGQLLSSVAREDALVLAPGSHTIGTY
jgi:hypothetical protein